MARATEVIHNVAEQIGDLTRSLIPITWTGSGIRGFFGLGRFGLRFWPTSHPAEEGTQVSYQITRQLYRNSGDDALGASFAKPIVDLPVGFMGIPRVTTDNEDESQFLNECVQNHWLDEIQQMFRDSIRDSKCVVIMRRPDILDPLMTIDEASHFTIEVLPPERVDIERNVRNKRVIERAVIHHRMLFVMDDGDVASGRDPLTEEHDVIEIISRDSYRFFDQTTSQELVDMNARNPWNFVPALEVYNEWDSAVQGGQSDLETVLPFIRAFHEVMVQGLQSHGYHSTPKIVMNLTDVAPFLKNNYPEALDEVTGDIKSHGEISFRGREMFFLQEGEQISFLEATSILGDTKLLLEFLIDCICIASQTPEWAFMRVDSGSANSDRNAQTVPFIKKIDRKRRNFQKPVQELCKMALAASDLIPVRPTVSWDTVRPDDEVVTMQAFQQLIMGLEVARQRGEISDATYQNAIRSFLPSMKSNAAEKSTPDPVALPAGGQGGQDNPPKQPSIKSGQ